MIRKWVMPSAAGATKARKSDGVIHDGTASTPIMTPAESSMLSSCGFSLASLLAEAEAEDDEAIVPSLGGFCTSRYT